MKLKFYHGIILGLVVALFFFIDGCNKQRNLEKSINAINNYQDTVFTERTKSGRLLSYNSNLKVSEKALMLANDTLKAYLKDIKVSKPEVITKIKSELRVDTIEIPIYLTDCDFDTTFNVNDPSYLIDGRITNNGITLNSIVFPNEMSLVIGYKKEKWWKQKERVATVTNTNQHMVVTGISSFTIEEDKKWHNKTWAKVLGGAVLGGVGTYLILK